MPHTTHMPPHPHPHPHTQCTYRRLSCLDTASFLNPSNLKSFLAKSAAAVDSSNTVPLDKLRCFCDWYTRDIQEIYNRYTRDIQEIYKRYTRDIQKIYKRYTKDIRTYKRYTRDIQEIYKRYTYVQEIYKRYTRDIQEIYHKMYT